MTKTERSKFRAHCKAEAQRFDAQDTPVTRALRAEVIRQQRRLRHLRIAMYVIGAMLVYIAVQMFYEISK